MQLIGQLTGDSGLFRLFGQDGSRLATAVKAVDSIVQGATIVIESVTSFLIAS